MVMKAALLHIAIDLSSFMLYSFCYLYAPKTTFMSPFPTWTSKKIDPIHSQFLKYFKKSATNRLVSLQEFIPSRSFQKFRRISKFPRAGGAPSLANQSELPAAFYTRKGCGAPFCGRDLAGKQRAAPFSGIKGGRGSFRSRPSRGEAAQEWGRDN